MRPLKGIDNSMGRRTTRSTKSRKHRSAAKRTRPKKFSDELTAALERHAATVEVLRVIARSPTDAQPVFDTIADSAARLCKAQFCYVFRFDGGLVHFAAQHGFRRAKLLARLHLFGEAAQRHPVYKHAETLLNVTFRKEKVALGCTKVGGVADQFIGTAPQHLMIG